MWKAGCSNRTEWAPPLQLLSSSNRSMVCLCMICKIPVLAFLYMIWTLSFPLRENVKFEKEKKIPHVNWTLSNVIPFFFTYDWHILHIFICDLAFTGEWQFPDVHQIVKFASSHVNFKILHIFHILSAIFTCELKFQHIKGGKRHSPLHLQLSLMTTMSLWTTCERKRKFWQERF